MRDDRGDACLAGLALALGRRRLGSAWPNPAVGAVVVEPESGRILAQAATARGGRPHAEPVALEAAGSEARGATLYISLEPCSHHGQTPPCADAIVAAGVGRVVSAMEDPDDRVAGRGHARLRAAGIEVATGLLAPEAARAHRGHVTRVRLGRPFLTLKLARTADGFAGRLGPRLLITGAAANARTHMLRAAADAVMVGIATALADDPALDVRLPGLEDRRPVRIVLDSRLRLPPTSRLAAGAMEHPTWVVSAEDAPQEAADRLAARGVVVIRAAAGPDGRLHLPDALHRLAARGLTSVLCEGGPALGEALAAADLVDELVLVTSPRRLDAPGQQALGRSLTRFLSDRLAPLDEEAASDDLIQTFERR